MPFRQLPLFLIALTIALPILTVVASWVGWTPEAAAILRSMAQTVLPDYALTSLLLCIPVALGVVSMGSVSALLVTAFDFPGRRWLEWALLLPMAMPAYVVAYAYTDFLQFSGPLQSALRDTFGWRGALWPDVRSVWGAAVVLSVCLYPYVYLLTRAALVDRAPRLMEAARLLGASLPRRILSVSLPLARPAIAAGTLLALMETLADVGVTGYFGVQTFATGVYKAWLVLDDHVAAAQLASCLLAVVIPVLLLEHAAQSRLRFATRRSSASHADSQPLYVRGVRGWLAFALCGMPLLLGFVLPLVLLTFAILQARADVALVWPRFGAWVLNSLQLGGVTAILVVALALPLAAALRGRPPWLTTQAVRLTGLGYAVPGVVIVVGLLLPVGALQQRWPDAGVGYWLTATALGVVWAYVVRFTAVALQTLQSGYTRIPAQLDESARLLGVTGLTLLRRVHAPLLSRSILAALLLVFVDVMKELPATLMLRPFNMDTLAVMAYQLARDERLGEAAVPSLALVLVGLVPVLLLARAMRRD